MFLFFLLSRLHVVLIIKIIMESLAFSTHPRHNEFRVYYCVRLGLFTLIIGLLLISRCRHLSYNRMRPLTAVLSSSLISTNFLHFIVVMASINYNIHDATLLHHHTASNLRTQLEHLIDQIIEHCAVHFFTGLPFFGLLEDILYEYFPFVSNRHLRIISSLSRSRSSRSSTIQFIIDHLSHETLHLLHSVCSTNGYVDSLTRTKLVIAVLICFVASPSLRFFSPFCEDYPARHNIFYARTFNMFPSDNNRLSHFHVSTATMDCSRSLDFSNLFIFRHMARFPMVNDLQRQATPLDPR